MLSKANVCVTILWGLSNLPTDTFPKESDASSPSNHKLPIVPLTGVEL